MKGFSLIVLSGLHAALGLELQPDLHVSPVPSPGFSLDPTQWEHSTPLLSEPHSGGKNLTRRLDANASMTQISGYWNGWSSIKHIFALYVLNKTCRCVC